MSKIYDYSPWCIITVNDHYMTIKTLEHEDNVYPTGEKDYWLGQQSRRILQSFRSVFENKILPIQYGKIRVWTNPNNNTQIPWPQQETKK